MKKFYLIFFLFSCYSLYSQNPEEIIKIADERLRGKSSYAEMIITIVRPKWKKKNGT